MSVNSSSSFNIVDHCSKSGAAGFIYTAFIVTKSLLFLPLSILVLYLGQQRWRQQRSFATTSHSDIFTYHMTALELIHLLGGTLYLCGRYTGLLEMKSVGFLVSTVFLPGQMGFHTLTCVERYLAVVHPVTYMGLKQSGGVKIRNISSVCVWLLFLGYCCLAALEPDHFNVTFMCSLVVSLIVVSFCSLRVLCVLIRPGPGDVGGDRERVDQSKQRAFHTIMAITGVLWLWFVGFFVSVALDSSQLLSCDDKCVLLSSADWFNLPSSLVLPVLFLQRAGKLCCCCRSNE